MIDDSYFKIVTLNIIKKSNTVVFGAAVHTRLNRKDMTDNILFSIELYEFIEGNLYRFRIEWMK